MQSQASQAMPFTINEGDAPYARIIVAAGETINTTFYPAVYNASVTDFSWEPYTGGEPSPSPDYPQELINIGTKGDIGLMVRGKNLLTNAAVNKTVSGVAFTVNADGSITAKGTATGNIWYNINTKNALPVGSYIMSGCVSNSAGYYLVDYVHNPDGEYIRAFVDTGLTVTIDVPDAAWQHGYQIYIPSGTVMSDVIFRPMLRTASIVDDTYEPYKNGGSLTASTPNGLPGIPVSSDGNYTDENGQQWVCDEVDFGRGVYVQRVGVLTLDGTNYPATAASSAPGVFYVDIAQTGYRMAYGVNNAYCSHYPYDGVTMSATNVKNENTFRIYRNADTTATLSVIYFRNSNYATLDDFKAALSASPVTVAFPIRAVIETALSAEELAAYAAMTSQYPNTTVYNDSNAWMEVEYADSRIDEIEEALALDNTYLPLTGGTLSGPLKFSNALTNVASPTVVATFIDNNSKNGIGFTSTSNLSVGYATSAGSATKATQDASGNVITSTYATKNELSTATSNYLPITGGTIVGEGTVRFSPQRSGKEGGEIVLSAPSGSPELNSIVLDNYNGEFRIFGYPSADGTTKTGPGSPLVIDPYDKTVTGSGGDYTFYAAKYVVSSAVSMEYDSTNECLNFVFN